MQNKKICENKRVLHGNACSIQIPFCTLQKGVYLPLKQLQKVIKYPLDQMACGIRELHATPIMLAIYR
jgi:hypothetical protein